MVAARLPASWRSQFVLCNASRRRAFNLCITLWFHRQDRSEAISQARFTGSAGSGRLRIGRGHLLPRKRQVRCGHTRYRAIVAEPPLAP